MARCFPLGVLAGLGCLLAVSQHAAAQAPYSYSTPYVASGAYSPPMAGGFEGGFPPPYGSVSRTNTDGPTWFSQNQDTSQYRHFDGFFVRTEYLLWDISRPGDVILGAPLVGVADPTIPFPVFDNQIPPNQIGTAIVPNLDGTRLENISGVKGTVGIPLMFGSLEMNIWGLEKDDDVFTFTPIIDDLFPENSQLIGTSTTTLGQFGNNIFLYNTSYEATFTSSVWGGEANIFYNGNGNDFITFEPLTGLRYISIEERLNQRGVFVDPLNIDPDVITRIDSHSQNNLFVGQIGVRMQAKTKFVSVAFDPKFGLGSDYYTNTLVTDDVRSAAENVLTFRDRSSQLSPMVDLAFTGKLHFTEHVTITAGYTFMWIGRIMRPQNNIVYDDDPGSLTSGIGQSPNRTDLHLQGINIGAEFTW